MGKKKELIPNQKLITNDGFITKWTYLKEVEIRKYGKTYRRIIEVQCECGRKKEVQLNNVTNGRSTCCGFDPCRIPPNKNNRSIETTYNALFYAYKKGAIDRGYSFELDINQFKNFLHKNCFYCGDEPKSVYRILNSKTKEVRAGIPIIYNGIDRINNLIGYTIDNSITCCETCNRMKTSHDYDFFLNHIKKIFTKNFV